MKKLFFVFIVLIAVVGGVWYLNRAYARFFSYAGSGIPQFSMHPTYTFNEHLSSQPIRYTALGDSLTVGLGATSIEQSFPYVIAKQFVAEEKPVVLTFRGFSGATTDDLINTQLPSAIADAPTMVTLFIGTNDLHDRMPIETFEKNYETIVRELTEKTDATIYAVNIPFLGSDEIVLPPYGTYFENRIAAYNEVIKRVADTYAVEYIDLYEATAEQFRADGPHYSVDDFHPSDEGYARFAEVIYADIRR